MMITKLGTNGYCSTDNKNNYVNNNAQTFGAYVYSPIRKRFSLKNINPLKSCVDDYFDRTLKIAAKRVRAISKTLEPITQEVHLKNKAGKCITHAWDINPSGKEKYLIFLHGTGQNITNLQPLYEEVVTKTDYAVFAPEFRGFGTNPSAKISSATMLEDATSAINYLLNKGIKKENIAIAAHSLGCQVATKLTEQQKNVERLILMSPIDSFYTDMDLRKALGSVVPESVMKARKIFPLFIDKTFDKFYGAGRIIKKIKVPVAIIHSKEDALVKYTSATNLAQKCKKLSSICILENGQHPIDALKTEALVDALGRKA